MKYREAIAWIAWNDDMELGDENTSYIISIMMVANLTGKSEHTVAKAVETYRKKNGIHNG